MMTGGRVVRFTEGWAVQSLPYPFPKVGHYYLRDEAGMAKPVCGGPARVAGWLFNIGDWTRCKKCEAKRADKN